MDGKQHAAHEDQLSDGHHGSISPSLIPHLSISSADGPLKQCSSNTDDSQVGPAKRSDQDTEVEAERDTEPTSFPQLSNDASESPRRPFKQMQVEEEDEDPVSGQPFPKSTSPPSTAQHNRGAIYQKVGEEGVCRMHRFWLYETASRFYIVGGDTVERKFRILKIDRTANVNDLTISEDDIVYTKKETNQLLDAVDDGNKASGGMKLKYSFSGLLGFVRFTGAYYMLLVTKKSQVAVIGGHYIYQIDGTELLPLIVSSSRSKMDRDPEESRFVGILNDVDLTRSFYFSYSYDVTHTLQHNILRERQSLQHGDIDPSVKDYNSMFIWNHYLLEPARAVLKNVYDWCLPIIHGFVDQAKIPNYGRSIYITILARRSRFFAGARFLKRGANDLGYVANDVETEQIVSQMLTTSFHAPGPDLFANPNYTSYVQHRGSIPLYWTQDNTGVSPKPDIELNRVDPFFSAAALHFDNLFERYGCPVYVLNLVKARERTPRESILLKEYSNAITYLNQFLPDDRKIRYKAWDMSRASKTPDQDVIGTLETIAKDVMNLTSFFHNGSFASDDFKIQNGVARTNCIDCLDRTNAAQFVIGKRALGLQLHALGFVDDPAIDFDTDAVNLFTHMFHDHGDTIAVQYGGSHLVNTMETYRKINQWTSHSRDMVESFKRYYNNSFLDKQRQEAYNLFLGNYIYASGQPMLWDLSTDYYLHHIDPREWFKQRRRSYRGWFTPENLRGPLVPEANPPQGSLVGKPLSFFDEWWTEYYRPHQLSHFARMLAIKMNSTYNYVPFKLTKEGNYDLSPFRVRDGHDQTSPEKADSNKKGVKIAGPETQITLENGPSRDTSQSQRATLPGLPLTKPKVQPSILKDAPAQPQVTHGALDSHKPGPKDKSLVTQWTLNQFVTNSLNPSVANTEAHEYQRYISHPLNLPLVVSTEIPPNANAELLSYVNSMSVDAVADIYSTEDDLADYAEFLEIGEDPLTVTEADAAKKRYKAYRQWVKGKSLFKQRVDP